MGLVHGEAPGFVMMPLQLDGAGALIVSTLPAGSNLIGRVDARGGDKLYSIKAALSGSYQNNALPAGNSNWNAYTSPANTISVVTYVAWRKASGTMTRIEVIIAGALAVGAAVPAANYNTDSRNGPFYLAPGQQISITVYTATLNDFVELTYFGHTMAA